MVKISLSAAEMTGDNMTIVGIDVSGAEWANIMLVLSTAQRQFDDLAYPATSGRSTAVNASGQVGVDWANVGAPTTTLVLSGTTVKTATDVETDTQDLQGRTPAALVSGRMDASVGAMAANVLTATAIAADAITDAKVASDVTIASVTGAVGSVTGAVGSVTGAVGSVTGAVGSVTGNVGGSVVGSVASVTAGVTLAGTAVQAIWDALTSALTTVGSIGKLLADNINATISTRATPAQVNAEVVDALATDTYAELSAVPVASSTLANKLNWLFLLARNKLTQTSTTQTAYADNGSTSVATSTVADDGVTASRAEWT